MRNEVSYWQDQAEYATFVEQEHNRFLGEAAEGEAARPAIDTPESADPRQ